MFLCLSILKTYQHTLLHFTPWSLDMFIHVLFQLHREYTVLQPFRSITIIVHITISVVSAPHLHPSQVKNGKV